MKKWLILVIAVLSLASLFCALPGAGSGTPDVVGMVGATLTALAAGPIPSETPSAPPPPGSPGMGTITGTLSYPASALPAMRVFAFDGEGGYNSVDTAPGQGTYELEVPPGTYTVVAYSLGGDGFPSGLAGGYTQMVPCGLSVDCTDHTLIPVMVAAGATVTGIDPGDWYADASAFPPMPAP